jgi:hypothetical protein
MFAEAQEEMAELGGARMVKLACGMSRGGW